MSDYWKKKLDELNQESAKSSSSSSNYWDKRMSELKEAEKKKDEELAPVRSKVETNRDSGVKTTQVGRYTLGGGNDEKEVAKTILGEEEETSNWEHLGLMAMKGLSDFNRGVTSTLALLEKPVQAILPGVATPLGDLADYYADTNEYYAERLEQSKKSRSTAGQTLTDVGSGAIAAVPQAILAVMSGGTSIAAQSSTLGASAGSGLLATASTALKSLAKNPLYWTSVTQTLGTDYEEAKENGASETEAIATAVISSSLNAGVEVGGGIDVLPDRLKKGGANAVYQWVKSALEEGQEEVVQGVISGITQKTVYDHDKEVFSTEDESAIINPARMGKEFGMGAAVGGVLGGGQIATQGIVNAVQEHEANKLTENEQKVVEHEYQKRLAEEDRKLSNREKNKLYDAVISDMEKGRISIDTIEEVLGGETYKNYQSMVQQEQSLKDSESSLKEEIETLLDKPNPTIRDQERLAEARNSLATIQESLGTLDTKAAKETLSGEVQKLTANDKLAESYNDKARVRAGLNIDLTQYDGVARKSIENAMRAGANNTNAVRDFVEFSAKVSADTGVEVDYATDADLEAKRAELGVDRVNETVSGKKIVLNTDSATALNDLLGHAVTHKLEGTKHYAPLLQAYKQFVGEEAYAAMRQEAADTYKNDKNANPDSEVVAKLSGSYLFTDEKFVKTLSVEHQNVFQWVYNEIKHLYKMATAGSKEARSLEKIQHLYEKAYREAFEGQKNTAKDSGVKYSIVKTSKMPYGKQLSQIENRKLNGSNSLYAGKPSEQLQTAGFSDAPFAMNQADYRKARRTAAKNKNYSSHSVPYDFFENMPGYLADAPMLIDNNEKVSVITSYGMKDTRGNDSYVIAGVWKNQKMDSDTVNQVKSAYPLDDFVRQIKGAAESGKLVVTNKNKAEQMLTAIGVQPAEAASIVNLAKSSLSQQEGSVKEQFSLSKDGEKSDADYLKAAESGDTETAQRMVDEAAKAAGYTVRAYHGTARSDRVGNVFLPERATSGPMAFFTDDRSIAENYSKSKPDTSMAYDPDFDRYETQFRIKAGEKDIPLYKAWGYLPFDARRRITQKAGQLRENWDGDGELMLDPDTNEANGGFQWQLKESKGNAIQALTEQWLNSGNLFNEEARFLDVLEMTGVTEEFKKVKGMGDLYFKDPNAKHEKVYDAYLKINNPFDTATVDEQFIADLEAWYDEQDQDQYVRENMESDMWDKNGIDAYDFAGRLRDDLEKNTTHAWTSIPDSVTDYLKHLGYDGIKDMGGKYAGFSHTVWIPFSSEQVKSAEAVTRDDNGNVIPLSERFNPENNDIRYSLSKDGQPAPVGNWHVYGKDFKVKAPTVSETESVAPVAENATIEHSVSDLADIAKQGRRENMRGAYTHNGKQYLSDGSFIAEFNTVDESLEQSEDFPIKQAVKELDEAFGRQVDGNYELHTSDTKGFVKVGNSLFGTKRVNALIRALENPVFSIAKVHGGHEALIVTADNGRAVLMPVRASGNAYLVYEAQPIADAATFPDDLAPMDEAYEEDRIASLDDADMPPETEAPYYEESEDMEAEDPFEERDWYEVSNRKVKAYMYDHPEVKPYFQAEAAIMLDELQNTTKGEKWYNDHLFYESGGEEGFGGTKRHTSDSIATMLDEWKMSYADIEKGLRAIIEDHGAENIAAAKKVEFMLNERLLDGYKSFTGYEPTMDRYGNVPQNQDYINMLAESQIVDAYSKESFDALMAEADAYAPPISEEIVEDIAPTKETPKRMAYEAIRPKKEKQPRLVRATPEEQARANVLTEEPKVEKKKTSAWSLIRNNVLDKGMIFEDLSLATGNRELQARWNTIRYADGKAQRFMEKNLKPIIQTVEKSGKTPQFYEYLYHMHNADRMSLEQRYDDVPNKPVFGDGVTAQVSRDAARRLEKANPEFKVWAQDIYNYNRMNRELLVEGGVISREVADLWEEMYPHYVPIRRVGDEGLNINVPLDTGKTGINAPIKRATGGNRDILPLFDTMGQRTMQTYKAVAKNRFGVELKNTLGTTIENEVLGLDEAIDSIDAQDGLLQEGKNGKKPTFTVFENGEKVTFEITDEMYDAMKPKSESMAYTNKVLNTANNIRRGLLTEYNPAFLLTNAIKDAQDVLINSQHPARTYANFPKAVSELFSKGRWYQEYIDNGGEQNTYFDSETNTFAKEKSAIRKIVGFPLDKISDANNFIERVPRLAEYIASRKAGNSIDVSMLDSARVTTNFAAGGDLTKFLNRNGATFLNASVQGAMQQVRNVREAKANGLKGALTLAAKLAAAGLPAIMLNHLLWDDDEEYAELSDYVKQNYYIVGKYDDGKFVRIPKGRTLAVIQNGFEQMENLITGNDEVDIATFGELLISNLAPNNPLDNNIFAPIGQAWSNTTWYGDDLVPTRLQDLPAAEQYDETTDEISKWLGEKLNVSPYKLNYLLDQYSGGLGDTFLPMITPEAERGDNTLLAPIADKFTTDSVLKNQNVSDFYTKKDELTMNAKMSNATDEDVLMSKYMNSVNSELSELYKQKREIQNSDLPDEEKYEAVRDIQKEIVDLTKYGLDTYSDVSVYDEYATVGDRHYRRNKDGEWTKLTDDQLEKQEEVTSGLGISAAEYWSNKDEYNFAYEKPEKYAVAKSVGGYTAYKDYTSQLYDIKGVDNDGDGRSDTGTRKEKVLDWINNLDADYGTRLILFKSEYPSYDDANYDIIEYLNSRQDISYEEEVTILKELGFDVSADGTISWD